MAMNLKKEKEEPEIPTASMADIAFLLIVFFMLTTVISATKGIEHILPVDDNQQQDSIEHEDAIYLKINPDNTYSIDNKEPIPITSTMRIKDYVYERVSRNYKKPIIVHADAEANYEAMIAVFDAVKEVEAKLQEEWKAEGKAAQNLTISIPTLSEASDWGL